MTPYVPIFGDIGAWALVLVYVWLLSAIGASTLSRLKGYSEKAGLGTGLILSVVGLLIWLFWPSKPDSRWRQITRRGRGSASAQG